jgi:hypothetical protein
MLPIFVTLSSNKLFELHHHFSYRIYSHNPLANYPGALDLNALASLGATGSDVGSEGGATPSSSSSSSSSSTAAVQLGPESAADASSRCGAC